MDYNIQEHRHRFAVWTAARAVQGIPYGSIAKDYVKRAIAASDLPELVRSPNKWPTKAADVDKLHEKWVDQILTQLEADGVFNARRVGKEQSYGLAAKIVAIYLKTCLLMCPHDPHAFLSLIHPPIDSILLLELSKREELSKHRSHWLATNWTQLTKEEYLELIASFREAGLDRPSFWSIERYWQPSGDSDT